MKQKLDTTTILDDERNPEGEFETKMKEVYYDLPPKKALKIRNEIINECGITTDIYYNWMRGTTPVPKLCRIVVSQKLGVAEHILFRKDLQQIKK